MTQVLEKNLEEQLNREVNSLDFDEIFRKFERPIYNYLLHLIQNQTEAEDLTQETFIRVYNRLNTFRGEASLSTWIYRIATNLSVDHFRRRKTNRAKAIESLEESDFEKVCIDDNTPLPDDQVAQSEMSDCVQKFIQRLPLSYRTVLLLHDLQGLKVQDIADVLDCSIDTVKIRLHRARNKLKKALDSGCDMDHDERNVLVCEPNLPSVGA